MTKVVILGAGVSGLTTALTLKGLDQSLDITVIGKHLPGDISLEYTSPFAGADWFSTASAKDQRLQNFDYFTYNKLLDLADTAPHTGIWKRQMRTYFTKLDLQKAGGRESNLIPWFQSRVKDFKIIPAFELPDDVVFGFSFTTVIICVPMYLNHLLIENIKMGNQVRRVPQVKSIQLARNFHSSGRKADYVVNCTGILVNQLEGFRDNMKNYPIRGQVLLVRNCAKDCISVGYENVSRKEKLYIMPRKEGGSIIGGCFSSSIREEDQGLTSRLISRAKIYAPELFDPTFMNNPEEIDIVRVNVGLRPMRESGVRLEVDDDHSWLIHNYGAGSGGYQGSYGFAFEVANILCELISKSHKCKL